MIKDGLVTSPIKQTSAVPSDRILSDVMGVHPIWGELKAAKELTRYHALISQDLETSTEAESLRADLIEHFGESSQQIVECDQAIRLRMIRKKISDRSGKEG